MKLLGLLLLFISTLAIGLEVDQSFLKSKDFSIKMPFVKGASIGINSRINDALYVTQMGVPAPVRFEKSFALPNGKSPEGMTELDFKVNRNDADVLEIEFMAEGCGAYCEYYTTLVDFDVHSGYGISIDDLLTPNGMVMASKMILKMRNKLYLAQIRELKQLRLKQLVEAKKTGKNDDLDDTDERIALNKSCIKQEQISDADAIEDMHYKQFKLLPSKGIAIITERCSSHADRALDDVGEVSFTLTPENSRSMLTSYGKALLQAHSMLPPPPSVFNKVFYGKLGGYAITVMFQNSYGDKYFPAAYYYNNHRQLISLNGTKIGKQIALDEKDVNSDKKATFNLELGENGMSGLWISGSKKLPVVLKH